MVQVAKAGRPLTKCPHPTNECSCRKQYALMVRIPKGKKAFWQSCANPNHCLAGSSCVCRPLYKVDARERDSTSPTSAVSSPGNIPSRVTKRSRTVGSGRSPSSAKNNRNSGDDSGIRTQSGFALSATLNDPEQRSPGNWSSRVGTSASPPRSCCGSGPAVSQEGRAPQVEQPIVMPPALSSFASLALPREDETPNPFLFPPLAPPQCLTNADTLEFAGGCCQPDLDQLLLSSDRFAPQDLHLGHGVCQCGDSCQCLGCATHPFNTTTKNCVHEMGQLIASTPMEQIGLFPELSAPDARWQTGSFSHDSSLSIMDPVSQLSTPPVPPFASDFSVSNGAFIEQDNCFLVEYPLEPCSNVTGTCLCGDNCSCAGCLSHNGHNGVHVDPSSTADSPFVPSRSPARTISQRPIAPQAPLRAVRQRTRNPGVSPSL